MARVKSIVLIEDEILEPFYIQADRECFTIMERTFSDPNHRLSKGISKESFKIIGHFSKFEDCLTRIAKQKLVTGGDTKNLKEFLEQYKEVSEDMKEFFKKTKSIKYEV